MDRRPDPLISPPSAESLPAVCAATDQVEHQVTNLNVLLNDLQSGTSPAVVQPEAAFTPVIPEPTSWNLEEQNRLVQVRLGIASSLFMALRAKHAPTAAHCLRVAVGGSSWAACRRMPDERRDELEVAALLHDIGKIGVPDHVLLKPGKLTVEEAATIDRHRVVGEQILLSCCASQNVMDIVKYAPAWYNGSRPGFDRRGTELPVGARVVAILEAFDAMTTDQVYRRAMSRERAMAELFECSGSHFDAELVEEFCDLLVTGRIKLTLDAARRWLHELNPESAHAFWGRVNRALPTTEPSVDRLFHQKLLDSMHDGILFVDTNLQILLWNRAAERLTGISAGCVEQKQWAPSLIAMCDEQGQAMATANCLVTRALATGIQTLRRLSIRDRTGQRRSVDAHVVPVIGSDGIIHGATLLLHDASSQITLEQQVQSLHEKATRDPLTQVANRAEFDRVHSLFIDTHLERHLPCALIICDIDRFKSVNDNYGHQAGDDVLIRFAAQLQQSCRTGDLVARYGGEEFVMLCADCDNATATNRAEDIRRLVARTPHLALGQQSITVSFGVTESQPGDTPETMLRRADRALLQAKATGRNRVVQLGSGQPDAEDLLSSLAAEPQTDAQHHLVTATLCSTVPLPLARIKLQGFASDHHAQWCEDDADAYQLRVVTGAGSDPRSRSLRPLTFLIELRLTTELHEKRRGDLMSGTVIRVAIRPATNRDRRQQEVAARARQLLASLKSYFMAQQLAPAQVAHTLPRPSLSHRLLHLVARLLGRHKQ